MEFRIQTSVRDAHLGRQTWVSHSMTVADQV